MSTKWNHIPAGDPRNPYDHNICGAKLTEKNASERGHDVCWQYSGFGTDHVGVGRCKYHGGASLVGVDQPQYKHGRKMTRPDRMRETFKKKAQALEKTEDTLDLIGELELQRHLLYLFLARQSEHYDLQLPMELDADLLAEKLGATRDNEVKALPMEEIIETVYAMVNDITKTATAISVQRKETVLTITEVKYLQNILRETFERFIPDVDTREEALKFFASRVGS